MIKTQLYLTEAQDRLIELRARHQRRTKAAVIRDLLARGLATKEFTAEQTIGQALLDLAALGKELGLSGPTDLSTRHDKYLSGDTDYPFDF